MAEEKPQVNFDKYIYFIDSHDKSKQLKISISPDYKGADTLEKVEEKDMSQIDPNSSTTIYRFKIIPEGLKKEEGKKEYEIIIIAEEENGTKHEFVLKFKDIKKDHYEYNFKIEKVDILPLSYENQFEIYVELLRKKYKKLQSSKENEEFILSTQSIITGADKQYDFLFYLSIFLECFSTKFVYRHLITFRPNKIKGLGQASEKKLKQIKNILAQFVKNPSKIHVEKEKDRQNISEYFYSMALYFYIKFNKENINEMFENEQVFNFLIIKLLEKSKNFNHILTFLTYLGKDVVRFLNVVYEKREFILKKIEDEKEEKQAKKEENKGKKEENKEKKKKL